MNKVFKKVDKQLLKDKYQHLINLEDFKHDEFILECTFTTTEGKTVKGYYKASEIKTSVPVYLSNLKETNTNKSKTEDLGKQINDAIQKQLEKELRKGGTLSK